MSIATVRQAYISLNSLNLGKDFVDTHGLVAHRKYPIIVAGVEDQLSGTLQKHGLIGGLAALYKTYPDLVDGSTVETSFDGTTIFIKPPLSPAPTPSATQATATASSTTPSTSPYVLDRKNANRVHIAPYAAGSLNTWEPKGEPDVYMVFGRLAEFTKFRYCCASSKEVLNKLGISVEPKPDAILIEEGTDRYLIAEFEVDSSSFVAHGHKAEDIDVLVCWTDGAQDKAALPKRILVLHDLVAKLLATGEIEL